MKLMKKFSLIGAVVITILLTANIVNAGLNPGRYEIEANPGDTITGKIININALDPNPVTPDVRLQDYYYAGGIARYTEELQPRGLKKYTTYDTGENILNPGDSTEISYTIELPEDLAPGTYGTAFLVANKPAQIEKDGAVSAGGVVGVQSQVVSFVIIDIAGDAKEELKLVSFDVNKRSLQKGLVVFEALLKNTGDVQAAPVGEITIFDQNNEQVLGVYAIMNNPGEGGESFVVRREDTIPVNTTLRSVYPDTEQAIKTNWTNRNVDPGKYTAKLKLFYGADETLEAEATFEIKENIYLEYFNADSSFFASLPANFSTKIINSGTVPIQATGYFEVRNLFGSQKTRVDLTPEELSINGGEEKIINNLRWDDGFAFGIYKANFNLNYGGDAYQMSTWFWVVSWWQVLLFIIVVAILGLILFKSIKGYLGMKKKLDKIEHAEKPENIEKQ